MICTYYTSISHNGVYYGGCQRKDNEGFQVFDLGCNVRHGICHIEGTKESSYTLSLIFRMYKLLP